MKKIVSILFCILLAGNVSIFGARKLVKNVKNIENVKYKKNKLIRKKKFNKEKGYVNKYVNKNVKIKTHSNDNSSNLKVDPVLLILSDGPINSVEAIIGAINVLLELGNSTTQEISQILRDANAEINVVDRYGRSALHWAAKYGYIQYVEVLINLGINVNAIEVNNYRTALHMAARYAQIECVQLLLEAGAEFDINDIHNQTPLHCAFNGVDKLNALEMSECFRDNLVKKYKQVMRLLVVFYNSKRKTIPVDLVPRLRLLEIEI